MNEIQSAADIMQRLLADVKRQQHRLNAHARRCSESEPPWHPLSWGQLVANRAAIVEADWGDDKAWVTFDPPRVHFEYGRSGKQRRISVSSAFAYRVALAIRHAHELRGPSPFMQMLRRLPPL